MFFFFPNQPIEPGIELGVNDFPNLRREI